MRASAPSTVGTESWTSSLLADNHEHQDDYSQRWKSSLLLKPRRARSIKITENLWTQAREELSERDRNRLEAPKARPQGRVTQKLIVVKTSHGERPLRYYLDRVAEWVTKFKEVGDTLVQYDPQHAALPWAGVRLLLSIAQSDSEIFRHMAEGIELVSKLITRYAVIESLYLSVDSSLAEHLVEAIVTLYTAILRYLIQAQKYYQKRTSTRSIESIFKTARGKVMQPLEQIAVQDARAEEIYNVIEIELNRQKDVRLEETLEASKGQRELLKQMLNKLEQSGDVSRSIGELNTLLQEQRSNDDYASVINWLSSVPFAAHHAKLREDLVPGSGKWLLENPSFKNWRALPDPATFWLHGKIGCGKTRLMSIVIQDFLDNLKFEGKYRHVAYFYCDKSEERRKDSAEILRSLVRQFATVGCDQRVNTKVLRIYKKRKWEAEEQGDMLPSKLNLEDCVKLSISILGDQSATILVDALDECNDPFSLIHAFQLISESSKVKIFLAGRDEVNGEIASHQLPSLVSVSVTNNSEDIERYIQLEVGSMVQERRLLHGKVSQSLKEDIIMVLNQGADGMFLWVNLQLQNIIDKRLKLEKDVRKQLQDLPSGTEELYESVFLHLEESGSSSFFRSSCMLKWLLAARRALSKRAMLEALSVDEDGDQDTLTEDMVLEICCNLVIADDETDTFRLAHLSVQEFLEKRPEFSNSQLHSFATIRCIQELLNEREMEAGKLQAGTTNESFRAYAAANWDYHLSCVDEEDRTGDLCSALSDFLLNEERFIAFNKEAFRSVERRAAHNLKRFSMDLVANPATPLFAICIFGLQFVMDKWLSTKFLNENEINWDQRNTCGNTALLLTIRHGHTEMTKFLLSQNNIRLDLAGENAFSPLLRAVLSGNVKIVELLLKYPVVDIHGKASGGHSVLHLAVESGVDDCIDALIEHNADPNSQNETGDTALMFATSSGRIATVQKLLKIPGINISAKNGDGQNALHTAIVAGKNSSLEIVHLLLKTEIDVEARMTAGGSALHCAAYHGSKLIVKALTKIGANVSEKDDQGSTPLHLAAFQNHKAVVQQLIRAGARCTPNNFGSTELHLAIYGGCDDQVIRLFIENSVDVGAKNRDGHTALDFAAWRRNDQEAVKIVRTLIAAGAEFNKADARGDSTLHNAARSGSLATTELFLEQYTCIEIEGKNNEGETALMLACSVGAEEVASLFMDHYSADLTAIDHCSRTLLHHAVVGRSIPLVKKILSKKKIDIAAVNIKSATALDVAVAIGEVSIVRMLLETEEGAQTNLLNVALIGFSHFQQYAIAKSVIEAGFDVNFRDRYQRTPLHYAGIEGHDQGSIVTLLLDSGSDLEARDEDGVTPLLYQCSLEYKSMATIRTLLASGANANVRSQRGLTPLHIVANAAPGDHFDLVNLLLDYGAKLSAVDQDCRGWTALHYACYNGNMETARILLDLPSVKLNAQTKSGHTPLALACEEGQGDVVALLLSKGDIDVNLRTKQTKVSPLISAAEFTYKNIMEMLLARHDIDVTPTDIMNDSAFGMTCASGCEDLCEDLLARPGIERLVSLPNKKHLETPLHRVAKRGYTTIVRKLLRREGVEVDVRTALGCTPLYYAAWKGHPETIDFLLDQGAQIDSRNFDGYTPLCSAARDGHEVAVKLLLERGAKAGLDLALELALSNRHLPVTNVLREAGAVEADDHYGIAHLFGPRKSENAIHGDPSDPLAILS